MLKAVVAARLNVLISGGTGSGKTTMLNAMSAFIDERERIVTIEDSAELQLQQEHVARLETRPANIEGKGEIAQRDLVKNALRMRPDRIIVGEVRAGEAFDMLQAMNTGHDGSMTTVHANTPRDALSRVEQMIGMSGIDIPARSARAQIASAIHVVDPGRAAERRPAQAGQPVRDHRHGRRVDHDAGDLPLPADRRFEPTAWCIGKFEATGIRPQLPRAGDGAWRQLAGRAVPARREFRMHERRLAPAAGPDPACSPRCCSWSSARCRAIVGARLETQAINQRLELIGQGVSRGDAMALLRRRSTSCPRACPPFLAGPATALERTLIAAGVTIRPGKLMLCCSSRRSSLFLADPPVHGGDRASPRGGTGPARCDPLPFLVGTALPMFFFQCQAAGRKRMQDQFPVALDVFVRGLRAGHPIAAALDLLTVEMPDPIGSQFGIVVDEVTYGADLRDALPAMADRWDLEDMRMFVVSLSVQSETGGNLAEILENSRKVIRERASMMMKVRALSSEGRMTAIMLTALPVVALRSAVHRQPEILSRRGGRSGLHSRLCRILIVMYGIGFITIRRMVDLKV